METLFSSRLWTPRPSVRIVLLYVSGIVASAHLSWPPLPAALLFLCLFILWVVLEWHPHRSEGGTGSYRGVIVVGLYLMLWLLLGFLNHERHLLKLDREQAVAAKVALFEGETLRLSGEVTATGRTSRGRLRTDLRVDETELGHQVWRDPFTIRLYHSDHLEQSEWMVGNRLTAWATLSEPEAPTNPGEFDYKSWLNRQGIFLDGRLMDVTGIDAAKSWVSPGEIQSVVYSRIAQLFDDETGPVARSLLTGDRSLLDRHVEEAFTRAGLAHIMAVSGLHVGFLVAPFWLLMLRTPHHSPWRWLLFGLLTVTLLLYSTIAGFTASVTRASLMTWMICGGQLVRRRGDPLNMLAAAAMIILLVDPSQLFGVGFQLSFSAVAVILLCRPLLNRNPTLPASAGRRFSSVRIGKLFSQLYQLMTVSTVVQTGLLPILIWYFGELSLTAPLSNLLVLPVLTLVVPWSMLLVAIGSLLPEWAPLLNIPAQMGVSWIRECALLFGSWSQGWIHAQPGDDWILPLWSVLMAGLAAIAYPERRSHLLISLLILLNLFALHRVIAVANPGDLEVTVLDVGQADAIHIRTPGGRHLLVDSGGWSPYGDGGSRVVLPYLEAARIHRLDAIILTHPHADHIGGVVSLLKSDRVEIGTLYHSGYEYDSQLWGDVKRLASERGVPLRETGAGDMIGIDPAIRLFVLGPDRDARHSGPNDNSVVVRLVYGKTSMLLAGDAERAQELRLVQTYGDFLASDLLKVPHHGSRTSSTSHFVRVVQPERAATSVRFDNRFSHPHREAVERLGTWSRHLDFTSLDGALRYRLDGENLYRFE